LEMEEVEQKLHKGVAVFRYQFLERETQNSTECPGNGQFYQNGLTGLFNVTAIVGAPIFYSWPHFFLGDPVLNSYFDGLRKGDERDRSFFDIQPIIGVNCFSSRKLQANIKFGPLVDQFTRTNITQNYYFPQFWMNLATDITNEQAKDMADAINFYNRAQVTENILLFGGSTGVFVFFVLSVFLFWKRRNHWRMTKVHLMRMGVSTSELDIDIGYGSQFGSKPSGGSRALIDDMMSPVSGESRALVDDMMSPISGERTLSRGDSSTSIL